MLKKYFQQNENFLLEQLNKSTYPYTAKALLDFYFKSTSIDKGIESIYSHKDIYPLLILVRCQIEHFIVAAYIWIQFRINKNDEIARIYHEEYAINEVIKRINYSKSSNIKMSSKTALYFQKMFDILSKYKAWGQKDSDDISSKAKQFDIRRISKYFDDNLPLEFDNIIESETIKQFLEHYNYYSSIVHGGPSANSFINEKSKSIFAEQSADVLRWSADIVGFQRFFIVYFLGMNNEIIRYKLQNELDQYLTDVKQKEN